MHVEQLERRISRFINLVGPVLLSFNRLSNPQDLGKCIAKSTLKILKVLMRSEDPTLKDRESIRRSQRQPQFVEQPAHTYLQSYK